MLRDNRIFAVDDTEWLDIGENITRSLLIDQLSFLGFLFSRLENAFQKEKLSINGKSTIGGSNSCASTRRL